MLAGRRLYRPLPTITCVSGVCVAGGGRTRRHVLDEAGECSERTRPQTRGLFDLGDVVERGDECRHVVDRLS